MNTTIIVQNLKCGGCVKTISTKISELENISNVNVNRETAEVSFQYNDPEDALKVKEILKKLGYPAVDEKNSLVAKANSFVSCATGKI
ncbi:heavy-metal-associated domain-containing protein [Salinimicrobium xinjiangense]|uniref:heavy-metal-associated domain-containing protein n=1 Tax=Salinimicrobium xinjiangense TaxID=438596 RepID=UPI00041EC174|nr:heavy metal-associated domain-containing protein [Salinimicrobium xinjiangense]